MAQYPGRDVLIKVDLNGVGGAGANWVAIGQQRGGSLARGADTADSTHKQDAGWASAVITRNNWGLTCEVVLDTSDSVWTYLVNKWRAKTKVFIQRDASLVAGLKEEGQAIITSLPEEFPDNEVVTGTAEFQGSGAFSISP